MYIVDNQSFILLYIKGEEMLMHFLALLYYELFTSRTEL